MLSVSQPSRIFSVTGTRTAATVASIKAQRVIEIAHQRRSRGPIGDLLGRAAHVDVDDVRALRFGDAGALSHPAGFAAGELHDMNADAPPFAAHARFALPLGQRRARGHFRHHQARPQPLGQAAERRIRDARHRRQNHAVRQRHRANRQSFVPGNGVISPRTE